MLDVFLEEVYAIGWIIFGVVILFGGLMIGDLVTGTIRKLFRIND